LKLKQLLTQHWNRFWFDEISARPVSVFRTCLGGVMLLTLLTLIPDLDYLYGPGGVNRAHTDSLFSFLHWLPPQMFSVWIVFSFSVAGALGLLVGFYPRLSALALYLGLLSFLNVDLAPMNSGERLAIIFAFLLIFARVRKDGKISAWTTRLIQLQVVVVYVSTVIEKLKSPTWRDGTAVFYASQLPVFRHSYSHSIFQNSFCVHAMTWGALAFELSAALLLFPPLRRKALVAAYLFHLAIVLLFGIYVFQFIMFAALTVFLTTDELDRVLYPFFSATILWSGQCKKS
jgi:hypothetical protein